MGVFMKKKIAELEDSKPDEPDSWDYGTDQEFYDAYDAYEEEVKEIDNEIEELNNEIHFLSLQQFRNACVRLLRRRNTRYAILRFLHPKTSH